jgi:hypothetical protein
MLGRKPKHLARLLHRRGPPAHILGHLPRLRDQLAVRSRHLTVRQVEVVLEPRADVAPERERRADEPPLLAGDPDHLPLVPALGAAGDLLGHQRDVARVGPDPPADPHDQRDLQRLGQELHVEQRIEIGHVPGVEALVLGLDRELAHRGQELDDRVEGVLEHRLEHEVLAPARVLGVVHRTHVQRRHIGAQLAQVLDPLLHRDADRAGRVVDDHVVDLGPDRLGDRAEVLDLVGGDAVRRPRVDVDLGGALVDRAARLGRVLLRGVGDRRALVAVGDHARDRAADDHRVGEAAHASAPGRGTSIVEFVSHSGQKSTLAPGPASLGARCSSTAPVIRVTPRASSTAARPACPRPSVKPG